MVVERREIWWAELEPPRGSEPGYRRPVLITQADAFNRSRLRSVVAVSLTSNMRRLDAPGNVLLSAGRTGLDRDSVANVSQVATLDKADLVERVGKVSADLMARVDAGLKLVLDLR